VLRDPPNDLFNEPPTNSLEPPCAHLCVADVDEPQPLYGLIRRSLARDARGTCLFEKALDDERSLTDLAQPRLIRELGAQCAPLIALGIPFPAEGCQVEPILDEQGRRYIITSILSQSWPEACDPLASNLSRGGASPVVEASPACRAALASEGGEITVRLENSDAERVTIQLSIKRGDLLGRCAP
jgi:hypothetical protein